MSPDIKKDQKMKQIERLKNNAQVSEKSIESYLINEAKKIECVALKYTGEVGYPDRLIITPNGMTVWVEVKSMGRTLRKLQRIRFAQLERMNQRVFVCDSKQKVDEVIDFIEEHQEDAL